MIQRLRAVYRDGGFHLAAPCDLPENAEVELLVQEPAMLSPKVADSNERMDILAKLTQRMRNNPLPANAPRFTRAELHERR
jgi:hypothetical protein